MIGQEKYISVEWREMAQTSILRLDFNVITLKTYTSAWSKMKWQRMACLRLNCSVNTCKTVTYDRSGATRHWVACLRVAMEWLIVQHRAGSSMCGYYWLRPELATLIPVFHFGLKYGATPFIPFLPPSAHKSLSKRHTLPKLPQNPTSINKGTLTHSASSAASQTQHSSMWTSDSWFVRTGLTTGTHIFFFAVDHRNLTC